MICLHMLRYIFVFQNIHLTSKLDDYKQSYYFCNLNIFLLKLFYTNINIH